MKILRLVPIALVSGAAWVALPAFALPAPISAPVPGSGSRDDGAQPAPPSCGEDDGDDDGDDDDDDGDDDDGGELPALT